MTSNSVPPGRRDRQTDCSAEEDGDESHEPGTNGQTSSCFNNDLLFAIIYIEICNFFQVEQKNRENQELTTICDDLIAKVKIIS